jgi:PHD/YefM family antitoxin component YafN of YafNO toxin-antitoxin module
VSGAAGTSGVLFPLNKIKYQHDYTICPKPQTSEEPKKILKDENNMTSIAFKKQYVVDEKGDRTGVLLSLEDYQKLLNELEELESLRAYDAAKASGEEAIPFEQAIAEIEKD